MGALFGVATKFGESSNETYAPVEDKGKPPEVVVTRWVDPQMFHFNDRLTEDMLIGKKVLEQYDSFEDFEVRMIKGVISIE